ncbi:glucosaminidase [Actinoplanes sp. SE50]|uniref:sporangiospore maturation cell wall hydrolase GsmA n=1 Tax=unclassified Actinoplanes TaxID=2626549 RepID=UPI00023ED663|nr:MULTISPECIES: sporangiospore maturation cell wall hydrolase GsmA [unclassified Actinoplanes]AEV86209.1 lysozyme [Actinoplanes sp. SE50/110]ATO84607.1 glucosaminidase [Actinoplanes sp. SE50]SLM02017.1 glucosaminidase [Actinoplanes sp. SE50/110]
MRHSSRRLLTGALLVLAAGAGLGVTPGVANAAGVTATVDVNSQLKVRAKPSLASGIMGTLHDGQKVSVACAVTGQSVRGKLRTTAVWDRLTSGYYVSDAYLTTVGKVPSCVAAPVGEKVKTKPGTSGGTTAPAVVTARVKTADGAVNVRTTPSSQGVSVRKVADGATVQLVCAVPGSSVKGTVRTTNQWDQLTDGRYLSHAYVVSADLKVCAASAATAPATPSMTQAQFIAAAVTGAQAGWRQFGVPPSVTIAQAILESGWGKSGLAAVDRNYFGIKCQKGSYGSIASGCHVYATTECDKAGKCFPTSDAFRTYASMADSFRDHGSFLRVNSRYAPAFAYTRDANNFIWQVWKAGYATDPNYYTKVTGLMTAFNLYRYDTWK